MPTLRARGNQQIPPDPAAVAQRVNGTLATLAAGSPQWSMQLPTARSNIASAFWRMPATASGKRAFGEATFDPATGAKVSARDALGGEFFYR
ncbi:hypothetical protein [Paraburkholderia unamae]|uniref:Uncharacterized protein n=1 Tax=Paraburkholderia unamae TaxID=219649 RepID=A0ACC6REG1_9BURK